MTPEQIKLVNLRKSAQKAYRTTDAFELDRLLDEQSRWKRKVTIATNKLAEVREAIDQLAGRLAKEKAELGLPRKDTNE